MSEYTSEKEEEEDRKIIEVLEECSDLSCLTTNVLDTVHGVIELAGVVIIPIDKFLPLFKDITNIFLE
ncbi:10140_t:CDS:1, partial [Acaulospora morrowiae]